MLGNCWEYDIRSSVIAWKMGYAKECIAALNLSGTVCDHFKHTLSYLEDKKGMMATLQYLVFAKNCEWARPAMVEIFQVKEERGSFINDVAVVGFINEQTMLDNFLFNGIKQQRPDLLKLPYLQTQGGSPSKSKCVAFLYQHEETMVMNIVRDALAANDKTVLASIHDAIITKEKLGVELTSAIEELMRDATDNDYWQLGTKQLKRYAKPKLET